MVSVTCDNIFVTSDGEPVARDRLLVTADGEPVTGDGNSVRVTEILSHVTTLLLLMTKDSSVMMKAKSAGMKVLSDI